MDGRNLSLPKLSNSTKIHIFKGLNVNDTYSTYRVTFVRHVTGIGYKDIIDASLQ